MNDPNVTSATSVVPSYVSDNPEVAVNLTPEGLMLYLESRLGDLDGQIDGLFKKQQDANRIREDLNAIQHALQTLESDPANKNALGTKNEDANHNNQFDRDELSDWERKITDAIADIKEVDPERGAKLESELKKTGYVLDGLNGEYMAYEVKNTTDYLNTVSKDLESGAQLEMIKLQSLMSSRQTAIQLSTNLVSALCDSTKSIASNVGR
jgi:hypothetical protein